MSYTLADYAMAWYQNHNFSAIAYSDASDSLSWSWKCGSFDEANRVALSRFTTGGQILYSGRGGYIAFAMGPTRVWGAASHGSQNKARKQALANCRKHDSAARIVLVLHTIRGVVERYDLPSRAGSAQTQPVPADPAEGYQRYLQTVGWGAISCSPSTRLYSYAFGNSSAENAELVAVRNCKQPDAKAIVSGFDTFLALARCPGGFGAGRSDTHSEAGQLALRSCATHGQKPELLLIINTVRGDETKGPKLVLDPD
jgi:hypothetical protein